MHAVVVVVVVVVVMAPQIKDPKRSGQVGLRLRLGPLEVTLWQSFPIRFSASLLPTTACLQNRHCPFGKNASNSLRVNAEKSN